KMEQSTLSKPEEVIIVGDYRKIKENKNLVIKSEKEYKKENIIEEMKRIEQEISLIIDESIPFEKELIDTLAKEKATLKQEKKYKTKKEKNKSEKKIKKKKNEIASAE